DDSGMGRFDSGSRTTGSIYEVSFPSAGTYSVIDTPTLHTGTVVVPVDVSPPSGDLTTVFTVTWAPSPPPTGDVYDVQIERPGAPFVDWMTGVVTNSSTFVADAGSGTYQFQARLRKSSDGTASGWSPAVAISVAGVAVLDSGFVPMTDNLSQ